MKPRGAIKPYRLHKRIDARLVDSAEDFSLKDLSVHIFYLIDWLRSTLHTDV